MADIADGPVVEPSVRHDYDYCQRGLATVAWQFVCDPRRDLLGYNSQSRGHGGGDSDDGMARESFRLAKPDARLHRWLYRVFVAMRARRELGIADSVSRRARIDRCPDHADGAGHLISDISTSLAADRDRYVGRGRGFWPPSSGPYLGQ